MKRPRGRAKEEAQKLFLSGEVETNAEIAVRLGVKPHTVGKWRKEEDWDGLRLKIDRRAAEMFVEKIATDRMTLNVRHYRLWELILSQLVELMKGAKVTDFREIERIAGVFDRAQKGQRLAKGMSSGSETEEQIRAQGEAEVRKLIDAFIEAVKENVEDKETREHIRGALMDALPEGEAA